MLCNIYNFHINSYISFIKLFISTQQNKQLFMSSSTSNVSSFKKISYFFKNKLSKMFDINSKYNTPTLSTTLNNDSDNVDGNASGNDNGNNNNISLSIPVINIEDVNDSKKLKHSSDSSGSIEIIDPISPENTSVNINRSHNNNYYTDIDSIINSDNENKSYDMYNISNMYTYDNMIISTLLDSIIDDIISQNYENYNHDHTTTNKNTDKKIMISFNDYYAEQLHYKSCENIMSQNIYLDMCRNINGIINLDFTILDKLRHIKSYKCSYHANNMYLGVFKTDNFIIKIDNVIDSFTSELCVMNFLGKGIVSQHNIVLPYYVKLYNNDKNKINMNFSIQPRIKDSLTLHDWISIYSNRKLDTSVYIKMCISISKSILFLHSNHIVHGDVKPNNILIQNMTNKAYIIDFGLSGLHKLSDGTGGTKPYCSPDTTNVFNDNEEKYVWTKNNKYYDLWSIALIFATILIFRKCYNRYIDYPKDFFDSDKYINTHYLHYISRKYRNAFTTVLCKDQYKLVNLENFIHLLESCMQS